MYLGTEDNGFENLWFAVYTDIEVEDEIVRTRISDPAPVAKNADPNKEIEITPIVVAGDEEQTAYFDSLAHATLNSDNPEMTYTIVLWIHEIQGDDEDDENDDQTLADGDKTFNGYVKVTSGNGAGVTGVIDAASSYDDTPVATTSTTTPTT